MTYINGNTEEVTINTTHIDIGKELHIQYIFKYIVTNKNLIWNLGTQAFFQYGEVVSGLCNGALILEAVVYNESLKDCKRCGLRQSNSIFDTFVVSGGGCGQWNICSGWDKIDYSSGVPY